MKRIQIGFNKFLENKEAFWITLILVFIVVRLAVWLYPYDSDHWIFYYVGKTIAHGGLLYVNAWDHKPPLIFEFNALMSLIFGGSLVLHRIFLTVLAVFDAFLFYKLATLFSKNFFKENAVKIARISLLLYVFWRNLSQFASSGNNTENFGLIFLILMLLAFFKWYSTIKNQTSDNKNFKFRSPVVPAPDRVEGKAPAGIQKDSNGIDSRLRGNDKLVYLFLSGVCLSILFYLKENFSLLSLPIMVEIFLLSYKSIKKFVVNYLVFGLPFLLQTAFWILYFKSHNALNDFWVAAVSFSSKYAKSALSGDVSPHTVFILIIAPFFVPLAIFAVYMLRDFRKITSDVFYRFVLIGSIAAMAACVGVGSFYPYYFLIGMPFFILVFAYGGNVFLNPLARHPEESKDLSRKSAVKDSSLVLQKPLRMTSIAILLAGMLISFGMSNKELMNSFSGPAKADLDQYQKIADYIKANSNPNDKIEAYTYGAVLYRMAERDAGSRYISASVLLLDTRDNYGFHLDDTFISDMEKSKAKYWIISKDPNNVYYQNKKIILYMLNHYRLDKEFGNYMVLKRK